MSTNDQEISITISAKNLTAEEFAKAREAIAGLQNKAKETNDATGMSFDGLKAKITEAFNNPLGALKNLITGVGDGLVSSLGAGTVAALSIGAALVGVSVALFELAAGAASVGAELDDIKDITEVSVPALSGLKYAAEVTGSSLGQVTNAIFMMQRLMQQSPDKFEEGLRNIHLSLEDIKRMAPDEQFMALARGIREHTNETNRAATAMALFGRGGREILPLVMNDLDALVAKSKELGMTWSNEEAASAEEFENTVRDLKLQFSNLVQLLGREVLPAVLWFVKALNEGLPTMLEWFGWVTGITAKFNALREAVGLMAAAWEVWTGKAAKLPEVTGDATRHLKEMNAAVADRALKPITLTIEQEKRAIDALNATLEDQKKSREKAAAATKKHAEEEARFAEKMMEQNEKLRQWAMRTSNLRKPGATLVDYLGDVSTIPTLNKIGEVKSNPVNVGIMTEVRQGLAGADFPGAILKAFMGGGNIGQTIGGMVGQELGDSLTKRASSAVSKMAPGLLKDMGGLAAGAIGSLATAGIGAAIPFALKGIKALLTIGGPSKKELEGRNTAREFEAQIAQMLTASQRAEAGGERWKMTVIGVRDAYIKTGYSAEEAQRSVERLWAAEKQGPEAVKAVQQEIAGVFAEWQQDQNDLNAAIEKYGFSIDELGPRFRQQKLDEQATLLMNEFRLLVGATDNVNLVIEKMSGNINEFINRARSTGAEVPESMRPVIEKMIQQGRLLDENGNKFENLESTGLTFSQSMTQGFDRIVKKFDELISKLTNDFPNAINNMPSPRTVHIPVQYDYLNEGPRAPELPGAAAGGIFERPTFRVIGESGPELVGAPNVIVDALTQAMARSGMTGGDTMGLDTLMTDLRESIAGMRRDLRTLGPTMLRAVRDGVAVS